MVRVASVYVGIQVLLTDKLLAAHWTLFYRYVHILYIYIYMEGGSNLINAHHNN